MATKGISDGPKIPRPVAQTQTGATQKKGATEKTTAAKSAAILDHVDLPVTQAGLMAEKGPLEGVIQAGLAYLAKAEGWEAKQNALGVLVSAMAKAAHPEGKETPTLPAAVLEYFEMLRKAKAGAKELRKLKGDAKRLVGLAIVALGTEGLSGQKRAEQEAQLATDLAELKGAFAEILGLPEEDRRQRLKKTRENLRWMAEILARYDRAFDAAKVDARTRLDAFVGVLSILDDYVSG